MSNQYIEVFNGIYAADSPAKALAVIEQIQAVLPPDAGGPQAQACRHVIDDLQTRLRSHVDMPSIRATIDQSLTQVDESARVNAELASAAARPPIPEPVGFLTTLKRAFRGDSDSTGHPTAPPQPRPPQQPPGGAEPALHPRPEARATPHPPNRLTAVGPSELEGVPAEYDDGIEWLRAGFRRHPWGVVVGLVTGWTAIWIALWGAAAGLVIGALAAGGQASGLGAAIGVGQAAGAIGIVAGAFLGAVGGFVVVARFLIVDHPIQTLISIASGAVLGVIIVVTIAAFERLAIRFRGYRRLSRAEVRRVAPLVKNAADAMNLSALPRFAMSDLLVLNAWTQMRTVVLTTGLLQTMSDEELRAVLAHELAHWQSGDSVGLHFVWAAAWPVALTYDLGMVLAGRSSRPGRPPGIPQRTLLNAAGWLIAWPAWFIIKFAIQPVVGASQRSYEYHADAAASRAGYSADLASALRKMSAFEGGRSGWEQAMAATHPPTELRLEALEPPKPDDYEYQEEELRGPTSKEVGRLLRFWKR